MKKNANFTMVEILVVTAIIGVLAGLSLSALSDARLRGRFARWLGYKTNLKADSSLVVYYDFQQHEGSMLKNEAFGINIPQYDQRLVDATINNASWVNGRWKTKGALWLNGVDSYAAIPAKNKIVNIPKEFSLEFWFLPISLGRGLLLQSNAAVTDESTTVHDVKEAAGFSPGNSHGNACGNNGKNSSNDDTIEESVVVAINNQNLEFNYIADMDYEGKNCNGPNGKGNAYAWGTKTVSLNIDRQELVFNCGFKPEHWYHVVLTYSFNDEKVKLFLNGKLKQEYTEERPVLYLFGQTWLGGNSTSGNSFNGVIDEFAVYDRALTQSDVKAHYEMGKP